MDQFIQIHMKTTAKKLFTGLFSFLLCTGINAQSLSDTLSAKEQKKAVKQEKKAEKIAQGKFMISPIGAPAYTPELGAMLAVGGITSFKTNPKDSLILRSSMPFNVGYSTTGAIVASALLTSYWWQDKIRINADFWYKDMPDNYWGVGYENGYNTPVSDTTTAFNRQWWWINPRFLYQFRTNYFLGLNVDYNYTKGTDATEQVANDANYASHNDKPLNSGLGIIARYDSRDIAVDAWKGVYLDLRATFYSEAFGGDNQYQVYLVDYRQYQNLGKQGSTLAWQAKLRVGSGDIPYGEMSQLGTPFDLRGYQWGRYRDDSYFFFLTEYRHMFPKASGELSKHGVVAWIGSGTVFNNEDVEENTNRWLPNYGVGYRFELQPRMHLRLDYGIGRETSGIYFNFNQAF